MRKLYAVSSGEYSDYRVLAIFEERETADTYAQTLWEEHQEWWVKHFDLQLEKQAAVADGSLVGAFTPSREALLAAQESWRDRNRFNEEYKVEEFDYYPGQELPAPGLVSHS